MKGQRSKFKAQGENFPGVLAPYLPVMSLAAAAAGQILMYYFKLALPGLVFFAAAAAMLVVHDGRAEKTTGFEISKKTEIILFSLIVLIAAVLRLFLINEVPAGCFYDEATIGRFADKILSDGMGNDGFLPVVYSNVTYHPCILVYIDAAVFKFFGSGVTQLRVVSAVLGILAVPAFYFLARTLLGPVVALIGAFLLAVMRWHINFSRIGFDTMLALTLLIMVLYFLIRAYRHGKIRDFAFAGFTIAASQYSYISGRLVFLWLVIAFAYTAARDLGFIKKNLKKIALAAVVAVVFMLPLINHFIKWPDRLLERFKQVQILDENIVEKNWDGKKSMAAGLADTAAKTFGMFGINGDINPRHNLPGRPMLDFITGLAALAGFLYALRRAFKPANFIFLSFFAVFILPGLITIEAPQSLRTMYVIPAVVFFALVYIERILRGAGLKVYAALALVLLPAGAENAYIYFGPQAHSPECRKAFINDDVVAAKYMNGIEPGAQKVILDYYYNSETFRFLTGGGMEKSSVFDRNKSIPLPPEFKNGAYMLMSADLMPFVRVLKQIYPNAEISQETDPYTGALSGFVGLRIDKEDIEKWNSQSAGHGLVGKYYKGNNWQGNPSFIEKKMLMAYDWNYQPEPPPSTAEWTGRIKIDNPGEYGFILQARDYSELYIDGEKIVENEGPTTAGFKTKSEAGGTLLLAGMHRIKIRHRITRDYNRLILWWLPPGAKEKELVPPGVLYY